MSPSATAPIVNWDALTPVLIILGAGVLGVLVEAFIARPARLAIQSTLSFLAILASGVALFLRWGEVKAAGAAAAAVPQFQLPKGFLPGARMSAGLTEDPFSIAAQGILLVIGLLAVLVMADRTSVGDGAFAAQAADRPGSAEESESILAGWTTTEVFPLTLFSLGGMMLFGASSRPHHAVRHPGDDLPAAVHPGGHRPPPPAPQPGGGAEVLRAGGLRLLPSSSWARPCSTGWPAPSTTRPWARP